MLMNIIMNKKAKNTTKRTNFTMFCFFIKLFGTFFDITLFFIILCKITFIFQYKQIKSIFFHFYCIFLFIHPLYFTPQFIISPQIY